MRGILKLLAQQLSIIWKYVFKRRDYYTPLLKDEYLKRFGIEKKGKGYKVSNKEKLKYAYEKAWNNRDFEIDKFWTRAAYFWGFIVLIFGGYISILTSERNQMALEFKLDLYFVLLGFLFSQSWYLVILGSKCWQHNWEAHIDFLENYVSGPLYKTIFYSGKRFYSVSKINEVMALVVFFVWSGILLQYLTKNYSLTTSFQNLDITSTVAIILTGFFSSALRLGYARNDYNTEEKQFFDRWG